jgi:hypothetical protein
LLCDAWACGSLRFENFELVIRPKTFVFQLVDITFLVNRILHSFWVWPRPFFRGAQLRRLRTVKFLPQVGRLQWRC